MHLTTHNEKCNNAPTFSTNKHSRTHCWRVASVFSSACEGTYDAGYGTMVIWKKPKKH